jgi:hypothetical protein
MMEPVNTFKHIGAVPALNSKTTLLIHDTI